MTVEAWCQHCGVDTADGASECPTCLEILDGYLIYERRQGAARTGEEG